MCKSAGQRLRSWFTMLRAAHAAARLQAVRPAQVAISCRSMAGFDGRFPIGPAVVSVLLLYHRTLLHAHVAELAALTLQKGSVARRSARFHTTSFAYKSDCHAYMDDQLTTNLVMYCMVMTDHASSSP